VYGHPGLEELLKHAFGAVELERQEMGPGWFHIEVRIGDSVVVLETGEPLPPEATRASIYVYVEEIDGAYQRALDRGATSLAKPEDKPYQERAAGVRDSFGNTWWISTFKQPPT
jgi:PhnB protein